jgi:hypothetical protein
MSARKRAEPSSDDDAAEEVVLSDDDEDQPVARRQRLAPDFPRGAVLKARPRAASRAAAAPRACAAALRHKSSGPTRKSGARLLLTRFRGAQVRMVNFMTYTDVTVEPGPRLNLILGPNGTGARRACTEAAVRPLRGALTRRASGPQARARWCAPSASASPEAPRRAPASRRPGSRCRHFRRLRVLFGARCPPRRSPARGRCRRPPPPADNPSLLRSCWAAPRR